MTFDLIHDTKLSTNKHPLLSSHDGTVSWSIGLAPESFTICNNNSKVAREFNIAEKV